MRQAFVRSLTSAGIVTLVSLAISGGLIFAQNIQWSGPGTREPGKDNVPPPILNAKTFPGVQSNASINVDGDIQGKDVLARGSVAAGAGKCIGPVFVGSSSGEAQNGSVGGYRSAHALCGEGAHVCSVQEILTSLYCGAPLPTSGTLWVNNGAPSLPVQTNDCLGWTTSDIGFSAIGWQFSSNGEGGVAYAQNCSNTYKFACCR